MDIAQLRKAATSLYGTGLPDVAYIEALADDLRASPQGVRKWWYGQRAIPGPVQVALGLMQKEAEK